MSLPAIRLPRVLSVPPLPSMPGKRHVDLPTLSNVGRHVVGVTDQYGLDWETFGRYPERARYYGSTAMRFYRLPLDQSPQAFGTFPELVVVGMCLVHGYTPGLMDGQRSFVYQQEVLGGRQPGGAVVDVMVYQGAERVAVRVQSVFHGLDQPFGAGGAKTEQDRRQVLRLRAARAIDRVVNVNRPEDNHPIENGPDHLVEREWERITGRLAERYM